jgi:hypothetical protein
LQQLELNKKEELGKVSANLILEKKKKNGMVWVSNERERLLNGIRFNITEERYFMGGG